jgi:hypothetical protein
VHRRTTELRARLDAHHTALCEALAEVPVRQREQPPAPDRWSAANVVEHVAIVEARIGQALGRRVEGAREAGLSPASDTSVLDGVDVTRYLDRERRIVSNASSWPTQGLDATAALARLEEARAATRRLLVQTDGVEVGSVTLPHPIFGVLTFYQWIVFLGGHEGRHALQIREVGRVLSAGR